MWLINHDFSYRELVPIVKQATEAHPNFWIGVNFLGLSAGHMFRVIKENDLKVGGVWCDSAEINEMKPKGSEIFSFLFLSFLWPCLLFTF